MADRALLQARQYLYGEAWPDPAYVDYVSRHRIDVIRAASFAGATAILPIADCGRRRFDWDAPGPKVQCFVCEALDVDGETTIDLVAWPLDRPGHVMSMFGRAPLLGMWAALNPASYYLGKALVMHRSPVEWLRSGCVGAAVLNPGLAARLLLDLPGPIAARHRAHAGELLGILRTLSDPSRVVVATDAMGFRA